MLTENIGDRYTIKRWLGSGAYGDVYEIWDTLLEKKVALKIVDIVRQDRDMALQEARCLLELSHPNIVRFYNCEVREGRLYLFTELLQGTSLFSLIRDNDPSVSNSLIRMALTIIKTVRYIHNRGIIHCDLKSDNILLTEDGIKFIDFGLASVLHGRDIRCGTISYTAPEVLKGNPNDRRSDIFSLGCILYEIMTKNQAFRGETIDIIRNRILRGPPAKPSHFAGRIDENLISIVMRCLNRDPEKRFDDCAQLLDAIIKQPHKTEANRDRDNIGINPAYLIGSYFSIVEDKRSKENKKKLAASLEKPGSRMNLSIDVDLSVLKQIDDFIRHNGEEAFVKEILPSLNLDVLVAMLNPVGIRSNVIRKSMSDIALKALLKRNDIPKELIPVLVSNILTGYTIGKNSAMLLAKKFADAEKILLSLLEKKRDQILRNVIHGLSALPPSAKIHGTLKTIYNERHTWYIKEACYRYIDENGGRTVAQ